MDSRILELAEIIMERCDSFTNAVKQNPPPYTERTTDKYRAYRNVSNLALSIMEELESYRQKYIEDYK